MTPSDLSSSPPLLLSSPALGRSPNTSSSSPSYVSADECELRTEPSVYPLHARVILHAVPASHSHCSPDHPLPLPARTSRPRLLTSSALCAPHLSLMSNTCRGKQPVRSPAARALCPSNRHTHRRSPKSPSPGMIYAFSFSPSSIHPVICRPYSALPRAQKRPQSAVHHSPPSWSGTWCRSSSAPPATRSEQSAPVK